MLCYHSIGLHASLLSFVGSCLLAIPAWRVSRMLKKEHQQKTRSKDKQADIQAWRNLIGSAYNKLAAEWKSSIHTILVSGVLFMIAGGVLSLLSSYCSL